MKLISNQKIENHFTELSNAIDNSDEATLCIAFLKSSGLNQLINGLKRIKNKTVLFIGIDFYLTEPEALKTLYKEGFKLFITKKENKTYHPKIYYFKKDSDITVFIGSSNLTSGGLTSNIETSVKCKCNKDSKFDNEINHLFNEFEGNSVLVDNIQIINKYEKKYLIFKDLHKKADEEFENQVMLLEKKRRVVKNRKKGEGAKLKEDEFIERLIQISEYKSDSLSKGKRKWLPSQTDPDPKIADLGNWLNDNIEWIKSHLKNEIRLDVAKERENDLLELGIYVEGIRKSYFEHSAKEYIEMRKKYPIENPKKEERKPYTHILKWETENRSRFNNFPEWRQKRLKEIGIVK